MDQKGVGRLLVASLHQSIAELLPTRLEFYESWLDPGSLRNGSIGLAPLAAVLSFLRQEGAPYPAVMTLAGESAAEWTFAGLSGVERSLLQALPHGLRARMTLRIARRLVRRTSRDSFALVHLRRGAGTFDVRHSIFCNVREPVSQPLCVFYAAAIARLFALAGVQGSAVNARCRGAGDPACSVTVVVSRGAAPADGTVLGVSS